MDDEIFLELVNTWKKRSGMDAVNTLEIFVAIAEKFPDMGAPEELRDRFVGLSKKKSAVPNIDGPSAESFPASKTMNSFHTLLCRRCFKYDCSLHGLPTITPGPTTRKRPPDVKIPTQPCGQNCHLNSKRNSYELDPFLFWTGGEQSLFRVLDKVFPKNFCIIAQSLRTKTCKEVHDFASEDEYCASKSIAVVPPAINGSSRGAKAKDSAAPGHKRRRKHPAWMDPNDSGGGEENVQHHFVPCHHPEKPCNQDCPCIGKKHFCEKFCQCASDCRNRFPGCRCISQCNARECPCHLGQAELVPVYPAILSWNTISYLSSRWPARMTIAVVPI